MRKTRVAVLQDHQLENDSRIDRTVSALVEAGYDTRIIAIGQCEDTKLVLLTNGAVRQRTRLDVRKVIGMRPKQDNRSTGAKPREIKNNAENDICYTKISHKLKSYILKHFDLAIYSASAKSALFDYQPDIIHANDLTTLPAAALYAMDNDTKIIYDSHEYEMHRNDLASLPWTVTALRRRAEALYIGKAHHIITVSDEISEALMQDYKLAKRPSVILNTPDVDKSEVDELSNNKNKKPMKFLHIGALKSGRGQEMLIKAMPYFDNYTLTFLGASDGPNMAKMKELVKQYKLEARVEFRPPIDPLDMHKVGSEFALSIIPIEPTCMSYEYSLPNKFFESIVAGLPVVVSPRVSLARYVKKYNFGIVMQSDSKDALVSAIRACLGQNQNIVIPHELSWVHQKKKLLGIYNDLTT